MKGDDSHSHRVTRSGFYGPTAVEAASGRRASRLAGLCRLFGLETHLDCSFFQTAFFLLVRGPGRHQLLKLTLVNLL